MVLNGLKTLKYSYDFGPDNIPSCILRKCADAFVYPLTILFNASITQAVFPEVWKTSYIIPLFKNGNKSDVANYRGIAKLSVIPKLFEKLITENLIHCIGSIVSPYQHGFQRKCSTTTNLIQFTTVINRGFLQGKQTDVIYTDFSKAFDKVNHKLLRLKLKNIGFTNRSSEWIFHIYKIEHKEYVLKMAFRRVLWFLLESHKEVI